MAKARKYQPKPNYKRGGELPVEYRSDLYGTHDCIIVELEDGTEYVGEVALIAMLGINIEDPKIKIYDINSMVNGTKVRYGPTEEQKKLAEDMRNNPSGVFRF